MLAEAADRLAGGGPPDLPSGAGRGGRAGSWRGPLKIDQGARSHAVRRSGFLADPVDRTESRCQFGPRVPMIRRVTAMEVRPPRPFPALLRAVRRTPSPNRLVPSRLV